ncbi:MAG: ParB/RepB/Spo0J family partition protein [Clostridia bacterium]|jgi:ParB family chromosome partitioning protein|nr:ParB/RepB/Spo0J family partition protein [Clostridia bacterium]
MINIIKFSDFCTKRSENQGKAVVASNKPETLNTSMIPVNDILPNPSQPRRYFSRESMDELTASVKKFGVVQPITVRFLGHGTYELVSGERRLMASKAAGLEKIPAIILSINDDKSALLALSENMHRQNLNFMEEAEGYNMLISEYNFSVEQISNMFGKSPACISGKVRLLKLSKEVRSMIVINGLSERHAKAILRIPDEYVQKSVLDKVITEELSSKKTEELVNSELEKMRNDEYYAAKREKRSFSDIRLFTNTIKHSVEIIKRSGVDADYDIEKDENGVKITISIAES